MFILMNYATVEPVYNGHPWDQQKWLSSFYVINRIENKFGTWTSGAAEHLTQVTINTCFTVTKPLLFERWPLVPNVYYYQDY